MKKSLLLSVFILCIPLFSKQIERTNLLFTRNSYTLSKSEERKLTQFIQQIDQMKLMSSGKKVELKGYIDMSPQEKKEDSLAIKRTNSVYTHITNTLKFPKSLIFISKNIGSEYKILPVTKEGQRLNRRVEIKFSKQRKRKPKATRSIKVEMVSAHDLTVNGKPPVSPVYRAGDTLETGKNGNAVIQVNSGSQLTLQNGSSIIIGKKAIKLLAGSIVHQLQDELSSPVTIVANSVKFRSTGLATIEVYSDTLRISQIKGNCTVKFKSQTKNLSPMQGYFNLNNQDTIVPLPQTVQLDERFNYAQIPGTPVPLNWESPEERYRVQIEDSIQTHLDTIVSTTKLPVYLPFGEYQYQIQSIDRFGFKSLWSTLSTVSITKKSGLLDDAQLSMKDTLYVDERFLPLQLAMDPLCSLSMETISFSKQNSTYSSTYKLLKGLNLLYAVTHYPDSSVDTTEYYIHYSGYDERFSLNDTIMNRPAFTTTRRFNLKGSFPTASSLKVNNEPVELSENGAFKKRLTFKSYKIHPVLIDITYQNGNTVRLNRTVERVKTKSEAEDALFKVLGLAVTGGILFLVGFGIQ